MVGYGRGALIIIDKEGADLSEPLPNEIDPAKAFFRVFSGDLVFVPNISYDLMSERYYKPLMYTVRGHNIHYTRVIDFTYVQPSEILLPQYRFAGVSEFEIIYDQLVNDGIMQRPIPHMVEKSSTLFYKVKDFKNLMQQGKEGALVDYFALTEDSRSLYGAGILDAEDQAEVITQAFSGISEVDQITLRRIAMVTGISFTALIGEGATGLSSNDDNQLALDDKMREDMQDTFIEPRLKKLFKLLGLGEVFFKDNQGETPEKKSAYQSTVLDNAIKMQQLGEDYSSYLEDNGIISKDDVSIENFFKPDDSEEVENAELG